MRIISMFTPPLLVLAAGAALIGSTLTEQAFAGPSPTPATPKVAPTLDTLCTTFGGPGTSRKALLIGNKAYSKLQALSNPTRDVELVKDVLAASDFKGTVCKDLPSSLLEGAIDKFADSIEDGDTSLIYFSGHGSEIAGRNYLYGVDYNRVTQRIYPVSRLLAELKGRAGTTTNIVMLDACRTDPTRKDEPVGFASEIASPGVYIAFATAPGESASDGVKDTNSPFATAFAQAVEAHPGVDVGLIFREVRSAVLKATNNQQMTWSNDALLGPVIIRPSPMVAKEPPISQSGGAQPTP